MPARDLTNLDAAPLPAVWSAGASHFINAIVPAERSAGRELTPIIDTRGYLGLRAVLLLGRPRGVIESADFDLLGSASPAGPFTACTDLAGCVMVNERAGVAVQAWQLDPTKRRYVRVAVDLHGTGRVIYGVFLELFLDRSNGAR